MNFNYWLDKIPEEIFEKKEYNFKIKYHNPYFPSKIETLPKSEKMDEPIRIQNNKFCQVWYHKDNVFNTNKIKIKFDLYSSKVDFSDPKNVILNKVYHGMMSKLLNPFSNLLYETS